MRNRRREPFFTKEQLIPALLILLLGAGLASMVFFGSVLIEQAALR